MPEQAAIPVAPMPSPVPPIPGARHGWYSLARLLLVELLSRGNQPRLPEPSPAMSDPEQVRAYRAAGHVGGALALTHLFHTAHACDVIRPGDLVLDLGCGPGAQLAQVARLLPASRFIGLDLSDQMLHAAGAHVAPLGISNIEWRHGDVTELPFPEASVDAVISSMALHHLPTAESLLKVMTEVRRVLKPGGGTYLADFARLKSERSIQYFVRQSEGTESPTFLNDYRNSLHAAFSPGEFRAAAGRLPETAHHFVTVPIGFMQAVKTPTRAAADGFIAAELRRLRSTLRHEQAADLKTLQRAFRWAGMSTPLLEDNAARR